MTRGDREYLVISLFSFQVKLISERCESNTKASNCMDWHYCIPSIPSSQDPSLTGASDGATDMKATKRSYEPNTARHSARNTQLDTVLLAKWWRHVVEGGHSASTFVGCGLFFNGQYTQWQRMSEYSVSFLAHSKNELIQWRGVRRLSVRL